MENCIEENIVCCDHLDLFLFAHVGLRL